MDQITLQVTQSMYPTAKEARVAGRIPMAYYGKGIGNRGFSADYQEFRRAYLRGGKSTILKFVNEKKEEFPVLVHDIQYHPVTDEYLHVDVMAVNMNKSITTEIPLVFVGESPAVKEEGGILMHNKDKVSVECLPSDLVHEIEVDISSLVDFHTSITVGDVKAPDGITITDAPDINVATVAQPRAEEEPETVPGEGEEGVEGAAGAEGEGAEGAEGEAGEGGEEKKEGSHDKGGGEGGNKGGE
jgi:large subunit ribosomal protein L25